MSERMYNMDEIFKSAYQQFREEPTGEVWKKITAALDKKDAESNKRRAVKGKQAFLFILLLMAGLILHETMSIRTSADNHQKNSSAVTSVRSNEKKATSSTSSVERKAIYVENGEAENKTSFTESNKNVEKSATLFTQHITPISLSEGIKTGYPKEIPAPALLFADNSIHSKNTPIIKPGRRNRLTWTYTPFVSYEWAQYRIDSDLPSVNSIKQGNEHEPSFSAGVLLTGQFMDKWMLQSGIVYSNTTIDIAPQKIYAVQSPGGDYAYKYITSAGYGYIRPGFTTAPSLGDSLLAAEAEHTLRHITIPLQVKYKIKRGKFSIMPGAGIAANFLTGTKVETEIKNSTDKETVIITKLTGTKNLNWSIIADAEMQYRLNEKMSVNIRPAFRYAISSITRNDDFQTFPYAFGIGVGMTFKF